MLAPDEKTMRVLAAIFLAMAVYLVLAFGADSYVREVKFEVDGSAKYVTLTATSKNGGTEQNVVQLPYILTFYAKPGTTLYLSAQKTRVVRDTIFGPQVAADGSGTVHVLIRAGGAVVQEAESSAPFGIATASGKVPD